MTRRFWLHVSLSAVLALAVCLFLWWRGSVGDRLAGVPGPPAVRAAVAALVLAFLFYFSRLLLRSTGSDRTMGLMGVYGVALYLPFVSFATASLGHAAAILLLTAALVEILDADLAESGAVRSGLFASAACVIEPASLIPAAALLPVAAAVARPRWKVPVFFALTFTIPWVVSTRLLHGGWPGPALPSLGDEVSPGKPGWWVSTLVYFARDMRAVLQTDFLTPYAALSLIGLVVATVRRMGPSRRAIAAAVWLLAIVTLSPLFLDTETASFVAGLRYLYLVLLASTGLAALAAMNPLHAGRRRMTPVAVFFLLPPLVAWARALL